MGSNARGTASLFRAPRVAPRWVRDLEAIDSLLRENSDVTEQLVTLVADTLVGCNLSSLSEEQWLRALIIQQTSRYDDDEIGFQLNDSRACRAFCRLVNTFIPETTIHANLRRFDQKAWSQIEPILRLYLGESWRKRYRERVPE